MREKGTRWPTMMGRLWEGGWAREVFPKEEAQRGQGTVNGGHCRRRERLGWSVSRCVAWRSKCLGGCNENGVGRSGAGQEMQAWSRLFPGLDKGRTAQRGRDLTEARTLWLLGLSRFPTAAGRLLLLALTGFPSSVSLWLLTD